MTDVVQVPTEDIRTHFSTRFNATSTLPDQPLSSSLLDYYSKASDYDPNISSVLS